MLLVCCNLLNSQNMPICQQKRKMVGNKDTSDVAKKAAEVAHKKSNNWPMVSFSIVTRNGKIVWKHGPNGPFCMPK